MGDFTLTAALATVIATTITGGVMLLTQRSAAAAAVRNQSTASRTDIEKEAFERAKGFYTDTIDRQDKAIAKRDEKITSLEGKVDELETKVDLLERARAADEARHGLEMRRVREELDTAKKALELRYPDEA